MKISKVILKGIISLTILWATTSGATGTAESVAATGNPLNTEEVLIKGFAKWQASRIDRILVNQVFNDIIDEPYVGKYFPLAVNNIKAYDGKISSKRLIPVLQYYIKEDINNFNKIVDSCIPSNINDWFKSNSTADERAKKAVYLFVAFRDLALNPEKESEKGRSITISQFFEKVCPKADLNKPTPLNVTKSDIKTLVKQIVNDIQGNKNLISDMKAYPKLRETLSDGYLKYLIGAVSEYKKLTNEKNKKEKNNVVRVHQMLVSIEEFGNISEDNYPGFRKLQNVSLFFASILDAVDTQDPDVVANTLDAYINDQDTYFTKRMDNAWWWSTFEGTQYNNKTNQVETHKYTATCKNYKILPCSKTIFLSSYYGVSINHYTDKDVSLDEPRYRAFGPVGVELKLISYKSAPISINYAPIDIGNYVTNALRDIDYKARFVDIYAPSIFLSYSTASKPVSYLFGYQRNIRINETTTDKAWFFSVVFDLPILTIY